MIGILIRLGKKKLKATRWHAGSYRMLWPRIGVSRHGATILMRLVRVLRKPYQSIWTACGKIMEFLLLRLLTILRILYWGCTGLSWLNPIQKRYVLIQGLDVHSLPGKQLS